MLYVQFLVHVTKKDDQVKIEVLASCFFLQPIEKHVFGLD